MSIKDALLPEYDQEMGTTRLLLERVPMERAGWKPHDRSMTLGELAAHIVSIVGWVSTVVDGASYDVASESDRPEPFATTDALLAAFDAGVERARRAIDGKSDAEMMAPWTLKKGGQELFTVPRIGVVRSFLMNHLIHHRGQLSVYLRMQDVKIPSIYGPSADERAF